MQDFGRRNPLIARQLADAIAKLREIHHHTLRLAEYKTIWLKKVGIYITVCLNRENKHSANRKKIQSQPISYRLFDRLIGAFHVLHVMWCVFFLKADAHQDEYNEMFEFIVKWTDRARSLMKANIIWNSSSHLQEQIRMYQVNHNTQKTYIA